MIESPAGPGSGESHLAVADDGGVVLSWLEPDGPGYALRFSTLDGAGWSPSRTVARGDTWFVNWADFPSVQPIDGRLWAAHWLARRPEGGYAYDVALSISIDGGDTWPVAVAPHTDGTPTEHGFVTLFPWEGSVGAVWLDGRNMVAPSDAQSHDHGEGGMTLRSALVDRSGELSREFVIDELTCDCCQTDVAVGPDGPIVVYRDRSPEEIRDVFVARFTTGAWQAPVPVSNDGWEIDGCPVNGPAVDLRGDTVVVAWFTAAEGRPRVRVAWSNDGARTFSEPIEVDADGALGRVDVAMLDNGDALVGWLRSDEQGGAVSLRRVKPDGDMGPIRTVGRTSTSRPAGFPQMVAVAGQVVLAWTEVEAGATRVRTARLAVSGL